MEDYKHSLYYYIKKSINEEDIYNNIKDDPSYICNLNEDGLLHSKYNETHYEPAIIHCQGETTTYYWLFNGELKDCLHPFRITTYNARVVFIHYYSSERIQTNQPITSHYGWWIRPFEMYNMYYNWELGEELKILDDDKYEYSKKFMSDDYCCNISKTPECYPIFNEMGETHFKFAD